MYMSAKFSNGTKNHKQTRINASHQLEMLRILRKKKEWMPYVIVEILQQVIKSDTKAGDELLNSLFLYEYKYQIKLQSFN